MDHAVTSGTFTWTAEPGTSTTMCGCSETTRSASCSIHLTMPSPSLSSSERRLLAVLCTHAHDDHVTAARLLAERIAPQILRYNIVAREILRELLKHEPRSSTPGLRALATRAGVLR